MCIDFLGDSPADYVKTEKRRIKINIKPAIDPPIVFKWGMGFNWEIPSAAASSRLEPCKRCSFREKVSKMFFHDVHFIAPSPSPGGDEKVIHIFQRSPVNYSTVLCIAYSLHVGSLKKQESSRKTSTSAILTMPKSLWLCGSQQAVENSSRDGNTRPPYLPPEKFVCRSRINS